ncbi:MAG: hypothetical protein QM813_07660 [Verrucomicrobiota bacterium]
MKIRSPQTLLALALAAASLPLVQAQTLTTPCSNRVISWNLDNNSTINPGDLAGLAPATNWVDSWLNNVTTALPDNSGAATTMDLNYGSFNSWSVGGHPGLDANGTANRELLNGYLNSGPAAWGPWTTNTWVSLTNVPYALYDVIVYFNADASGRKSSIEGPNTTYHFSTMGSAVRSGANALFLPTAETNTAVFPTADFAVWRGLTSPNARFTTYPKSGNDQWLGICAFQVIESSNAYCIYGPAPATQIVPVGQPAAFNVIAGGQNVKYRWRHAGVPIANATNATYSIATTAAGQDGAYDVVITNSFSSITSSVATLTFYSPKSLEWAGNNSAWDTTTTAWTTNGGLNTTLYTETDNVLFGALGIAQPTVTLSGTRTPSSLTVSNGSYLLAGGSLSGPGALRLKNNATLIIDTPDTRSGPTLIDAGSTLQLDNNDTAGSLGSGALTNNGALLFNAAGDEAYGYPIYGSGSITNLGTTGLITLGSDVRANYLAQAGFGSLLLQGSNTLSGGLIVSGGQVWARAQDCLGQGPTILSGGELQLNFTLNYSGTSMSLAGGTLRGGVGGANTYAGVVSLATDSQINVDSGSGLTLNNAAGLNGGSFNLSLGGGGTLVLAGGNNTWASLTINNGTVQIGSGGSAGSIGSGAINNAGAISFNTSSSLTVTNDIVGSGAVNQNGSGLTTLTADLNSAGFGGGINVNAGTLRINGTSGDGTVTVNTNGTLGGTGTLNGAVDVLSGGTLAPGAGLGTLTIAGNLTLAGNLAVEVNKSLSPSNDVVVVNGTLANLGTGVVSVSNLGGALAVGNKFKLFNQPVSGGATLSVSGAGVVWANNLELDGSIQVASLSVPQPRIVSTTLSGGNLIFSGTNGVAGNPYQVVSSTNIAAPLSSWTQTSTGNFDGSGNFSVTNAINVNEPQRYYLLRLP